MSRGLKALEVLLEVADGYNHTWEEIDKAKETIKLELRWLDGYSEQLAKRELEIEGLKVNLWSEMHQRAKREEQLDKIKDVIKQKFSISRRLEDIKQILEED